MPNPFQSSQIAHKSIFCVACFCILILSTFATCKKDIDAPPAFPAATQTGANTMGAIVNNNQFIVYQLPGSLLQSLFAQYADQKFTLNGFDPSNEFQGSISINIYHISGTGNYKLINQNGFNGNNWGELGISSGRYLTDSLNTGSVTITRFDTVNHIISGVFSMLPKIAKLSSSDTTAIVNSGRFDVAYIPAH